MEYTLQDLVEAIVDRQRFAGAKKELADFSRAKADALELAFGVSTKGSLVSNKRPDPGTLFALRAVINKLSVFRSPFEGFLEGKVNLPEFENHRTQIHHDLEALRSSCRTLAVALLAQLGEISVEYRRTSEDLLRVGFDDRYTVDPGDFA